MGLPRKCFGKDDKPRAGDASEAVDSMDPEEAEHDEQEHNGAEEAEEFEEEDAPARPRELPADLPRSLDDRRTVPSYGEETEYYDAWQGTKAMS